MANAVSLSLSYPSLQLYLLGFFLETSQHYPVPTHETMDYGMSLFSNGMNKELVISSTQTITRQQDKEANAEPLSGQLPSDLEP